MELLDCTIRDGGYINNWRFSDEFISEYIDVMNRCNVDYVEVGFINKQRTYRGSLVGKYRNLTEDTINMFKDRLESKIVVMGDYVNVDINLLEKKIDVDVVRIAFHKSDMIGALDLCRRIKEMGYTVSANAMAVTNYSDSELNTLFNTVNRYNIDMLYIADSYGSLSKLDLRGLLDRYSANTNAKIGIHLHNNMQNAFSNFESILGEDLVVDSTMYGMGRGAGNLNTELAMIKIKKDLTMDELISVCAFIQTHMKTIYESTQNRWGYDLDYMLAGYVKIHPNYVAKMRDIDIKMIHRFNVIKYISDNNMGNTFDLNIFNDMIDLHRDNVM